ncbi:MAG: hypothetical protein IJ461_00065 [Clostridia bacterium]|nr:hypothetical protein [Clostridia bacterium]
MSPKTGRPLAGEEPKNKQLAFNVTATTVRKFTECAIATNKTKVALLEEMVNDLHQKVCIKK